MGKVILFPFFFFFFPCEHRTLEPRGVVQLARTMAEELEVTISNSHSPSGHLSGQKPKLPGAWGRQGLHVPRRMVGS